MKKISVRIICIFIMLLAGFLIGKSCESYCSTCNGYSLFPLLSIVGIFLLVIGLRLFIKISPNIKYEPFLFIYGLLLLTFGLFVSYSSKNELIKIYGKYREGVVIEFNVINIIILVTSSFILCSYFVNNFYKKYVVGNF